MVTHQQCVDSSDTDDNYGGVEKSHVRLRYPDTICLILLHKERNWKESAIKAFLAPPFKHKNKSMSCTTP